MHWAAGRGAPPLSVVRLTGVPRNPADHEQGPLSWPPEEAATPKETARPPTDPKAVKRARYNSCRV